VRPEVLTVQPSEVIPFTVLVVDELGSGRRFTG
jgi:hypothetical protein